MKKLNHIFAAALLSLTSSAFAGNCPALSGSFTIGHSSAADFSTIQQAADAMQCGGINSPVLFKLESGVYDERVSLSDINGASAVNTIVFESMSGEKSDVTISNHLSDVTIVLNGTSYVSFENMTIDRKGATYGNCVRAEGKINHLAFKNVIFDGVENDVTGTASAVLYFNSTAAKTNISVSDCELNNGSIGLLKGGVDSDNRDSKTILSGNLFFNQFQAGMVLSNEDAPEISNNVVSSTSAFKNFKGIGLDNAANQIIITKNIVNTPHGMTGLSLNDCEAKATDLGQITNNSILSGGAGISINGSTENQILNFNRVKLSITGGNKAYYANKGTGNNINMMNNIFYDMNTGAYTIVGNSYKDFFNQLPGQSNPEMSASANAISIEKVSPIK